MKRYIRGETVPDNIPVISSLDELYETISSMKYNYYGLRGAHEDDMNNLSRGYLDCSSDWTDGDWSDDKLNGTCALNVYDDIGSSELLSRYNKAKTMYSPIGVVLLIADNNMEYGEDDNEVILGSNGYGADVVAVVDLESV